tara:strand:- start:700706 stop:701791 length:1086 start_codon:yes stop_codon:yes gene_type:complete
MLFNAHFFDGKSSRTHEATVKVNALNWQISYNDEHHTPIVISWNPQKIQKSDVYTKGLISFTYGDTFPFQKIESEDPSFINYINNSDQKNLNNRIDVRLHKSKYKSLVFLLIGILGIGILSYFYVIPTVATGFASTLSQKNVIDFGDYVFRVLSTDLEIDEEASERLQNFVDAMDISSEFPLKLYVATSDEMNAFALSGGKIVVFSTLLEKIETDAQLAALIGHEVSHINNRHVLKNLARNFGGAIFVSVLFGDINGATAVLMDNAHLFTQLSFSRSLEKEADVFGLDIMKKNNVDLHGMPQLFEILKKESSFDVPTYLSNHPMLEDRITYTTKIADEQGSNNGNDLLQDKWNQLEVLIKE